ncbi:MAG: nucleoside-diphosphate sugar epimerase/dehydratase [Bacteroidales bacterium]|nr:nucleoside-diphosphate sugar epimerase/dehydratase [Bacteroidales bacterium]
MIPFQKNTPRWLIFLVDIFICFLSVIVAYELRFNFVLPEEEISRIPRSIAVVLLVRGLSFIIGKTYAGIIKYTSSKDAERIFIVLVSGSLIFVLLNVFKFYFVNRAYILPFSIIIIDFLFTILAMTGTRLFVKSLFWEITNPSKGKKNVIIIGAGEHGLITKRSLDRDAGTKYKVIAFIDVDKNKIGKKVEGIDIYGQNELDKLLKDNEIENIILSVKNISPDSKDEIVEKALQYNVRVLSVPPVERWINGELSFKQIKKVKIEELLERDIIVLDKTSISKQTLNKTILITGAAGSIGSGLVKQLIEYSPKKMILIDQAETPLYELELEVKENLRYNNAEFVLCDIRNSERIKNIFQTYRPEIVYHSAAYKHVPMMENNPVESINTNVNGTKILADLSIEYGTDKFIMISTDKAVNPTGVMGASKRIAEIYAQSLNGKSKTKFITTRFGNVLESNGSVIERFRKQIEKGGPITVTHPEITRFFMTIPEACQLVLEAGAMGKGGEIFIFDMGKSIKINDLAKKMIKLSRLTLGKDIHLIYTGLRPGEKLYEELLNDEENTTHTHHPKIMIAKVKEYNNDFVNKKINELAELAKTQDTNAIVRKMKEVVPEFKSQNSIYKEFDELTEVEKNENSKK